MSLLGNHISVCLKVRMCLNAFLMFGFDWPTSAGEHQLPSSTQSLEILTCPWILYWRLYLSFHFRAVKVTAGQCCCLLGSPESLISGLSSARGCTEIQLILLLAGYLVLSVIALAFDIGSKDFLSHVFRGGSWRTLKNLFSPYPEMSQDGTGHL